jgi:hypothetical protein
MITENDIQKFDSETQKQIRIRIGLHVKNGRPVEFLLLNSDGSIMYDSEEHNVADELSMYREVKKP